MARPLVMGADEEAKLRDLRAFAEANPISLIRVMEMINKGPDEALGNHPQRHCEIPFGFRVAFTVEQHPDGWYRHASISVDGARGSVPNPLAVAWLTERLGFQNTKKFDASYIENPKDPHPAVNVLEKTDEPMSPYANQH